MKAPRKLPIIPLSLDQKLHKEIRRLSKKLGEPASTIMRMAIRLGLAPLERSLEEAKRADRAASKVVPVQPPLKENGNAA